MSAHEQETESPKEDAASPTQAQLYDDLRRIGQLEDEKQKIQSEIEERTERLRNALPHLDPESLLHRMLASALKPNATRKRSTASSGAAKQTPRKKRKR